MQLFCFSYAGGTASFFTELEKDCDNKIEFVKLEYPGHGDRRKETLCESFDEITADLYSRIKDKLTSTEYALLGYSMGSIAVFDMLRTIESKGEIYPPRYVFLASHEPNVEVEMLSRNEEEIDAYVRARTIAFGGIPERLLDNKSFWRTYLPIYKADYYMINKYDFHKTAYLSKVPATVFYSESDISSDLIKGWNAFFVNGCDYVQYAGGHFFINEHHKEMAQQIIERLEVET